MTPERLADLRRKGALDRHEAAEVMAEIERLQSVLKPMRLRRAIAVVDEIRREWLIECSCNAWPCSHSEAWDRYDEARGPR